MSHNLNIVLCYNICLYEDEINAVWVHFLLILSFFKFVFLFILRESFLDFIKHIIQLHLLISWENQSQKK